MSYRIEEINELNKTNLKKENEKLAMHYKELKENVRINFIKITKLKSQILNSTLKNKDILKETFIYTEAPFIVRLNELDETNLKYKEKIVYYQDIISKQQALLDKLNSTIMQVQDENLKEKFISSKIENGVKISAEERKANDNYKCAKCSGIIFKGSQYICLTEHEAINKPIPKKIYGGRQYSRTEYKNFTSHYHIGCYE